MVSTESVNVIRNVHITLTIAITILNPREPKHTNSVSRSKQHF